MREITEKKRTFDKLVWIFFFCSLIGLISEGTYTFWHTGHWQSHVITMVLPVCPIYGLGALIFWFVDNRISKKVPLVLKALIIGTFATAMEFICGLFLYYVLHMRAWDYRNIPTNVLGIFCPEFLVVWSVFGLAYLLVVRQIHHKLDGKPKLMNHRSFHVFTVIFAVLFFLDMLSAWVFIFFWSGRHYGDPVDTKAETVAEQIADDDFMRNRFVEWRFLDETGELPKEQNG